MSSFKPSRAMNLNSLLMGADNIKPPSKPNEGDSKIVRPPTMASLLKFETQSKKIEEVKKVDNETKVGVKKIADGLGKFFDKAEEDKKIQDDSSSFKNNKSNFKMSPGSKKARPGTAQPVKRASAFAKRINPKESEGSSDSESGTDSGSESSKSSQKEEVNKNTNLLIVSDSSSSDSDGPPQATNFGKINSYDTSHINPLTMVKFKQFKSKELKEQNLNKLLENKSEAKQYNTPMMHRRKVLVTNQSGIPPSINSKFGFRTLEGKDLPAETEPARVEKTNFKFDISLNVLSKQSSLMTPNHTLDNTRKLLQMSGIGEYIMPKNRKSKDEADIKTQVTYVSLLKDDLNSVESWSKSFSEAINEVKVENKEYLSKVNPKIQKMFMRNGTLTKKTVIFGLDGVLVKTSFAKEGPEWKKSELILDKNKNQKMNIYVAVRPYVINTLKQLKRAGIEVILYSASQSNYTNAILKILFKQRVEFHHIV